jgi:tRNA uracil 4-sulfurtransferase
MKSNQQKGILIAFGEMFLKSDSVRKFFKQKLVDSLVLSVKKVDPKAKIVILRERIFIQAKNPEKLVPVMKNISGTSWAAEAFYFPKFSLAALGKFVDENYHDWMKKGETFAIRLNLQKSATKDSPQKIIERIARNISNKVDLKKPDKEIFVEIKKEGAFLYFKKEKGLGGFPAGASGKISVLMSGGIDSPVAAHLMLRKGVNCVWLHFHSFPLVSNKSIEKIKELAEVFRAYQSKLKIYFLPFSKAQVEIKAKAPANYRILLYRRLMFRIAEEVSQKENCRALATGESLGQVSSQTLPNMNIIEEAVKIPVLRPLIVMDKQEITDLAKKIGTYAISIKPHEDCCTLFTPKHSSAEGKMEDVKKWEKKLNIKKIIRETIKEKKIVVI